MTITTITYPVALAMSCSSTFDLDDFVQHAGCNHVMNWVHYNFINHHCERNWNVNSCGIPYSHHKVETKCHLCGYIDDQRNYTGIGCMWLLHNGISDEEILVWDDQEDGSQIPRKRGHKKQNFRSVPNRNARMVILCDDCIGSYFEWPRPYHTAKKTDPVQLELFPIIETKNSREAMAQKIVDREKKVA